jgi:hypothetical protein
MTTVERIDEDRFDDMLYTLPPEQWTHDPKTKTESFRFQERLDFDTAWYFCRLGKEYFEIKGPLDLTHDEIVGRCGALL